MGAEDDATKNLLNVAVAVVLRVIRVNSGSSRREITYGSYYEMK